ncbi:MAG TPA: hypothetical protein VFM80_12895 [Gracilimonas sp.]|uniref:hypothetical protein n=1 Tax=Gracilimonas sp. TaxID=1974203 RepID=UPI002D84DC20|nr:hypothetical protein [Gracilimonas sp.]
MKFNFRVYLARISPALRSVIIIRGSGSMIFGDEVHELGRYKMVFISPETLHQLHAEKWEPLRFTCIVNRYRDIPTLPDNEYLNKNVKSENVQKKIKR